VLYEGLVAMPRNVDLDGRSEGGAAITFPVSCCEASPGCANAFITCDGLRKRVLANNPIAPRKFPSGSCKIIPGKGLLHRMMAAIECRRRVV
jgi:hypothetical protein